MNAEEIGLRRGNTLFAKIADNLPYLVMVLLGAGVFLEGLGVSLWGWLAAGLYVLYSLVGVLWIILFMCPYCRYYGSRRCPCGYGRIAARLRSRQAEDRFAEKFKQHIPVIVPLWFIPPLFGAAVAILAIDRFTWILLGLLVAFVVDAFIVLPLVSRKYGCRHCPQRADCPWMSRKDRNKQ